MKTYEMKLKPEEAFDDDVFNRIASKRFGENKQFRIARRSIDARKKQVWVNVLLEVYDQTPPPLTNYDIPTTDVSSKDPVIVVGSGPAGLFAGLRLIELGIKPIILERGKDVRDRRRDIAAINKEHIVNEDSNYCFGEGGAGTYSDGKLYTRSKKRGDVQRVLEILVKHGATEKILYEAHPHIGTNKLPKVVTALRESIEAAGGEVHFDCRVDDFIIEKGEMVGVRLANGDQIRAKGVILATGHSARDIFHILQDKKVKIESKPFALGVRVEHPQQLIDQIQYNCNTERGDYLPASSYALVNQTYYEGEKRGVFSFCMCPGGFIVPAATSAGEVVVNGMSPSRRDSKYANSGIVVAVNEEDIAKYSSFGDLAGLQFQKEVEQKACVVAGNDQTAPAQRLVDFVNGKASSALLDTSYQPGLKSVKMDEVLPDFINASLKQAFKAFGKKMKGYLTNEAQIVGVESRTSSPVRIPRDRETLEHLEVKRLYPCGEGAGYAGGIVSAAMDGERCAEAIAQQYFGVTV
ncbi:FAD-binding protein [Fulvivirga sp. RKSG066]|uniref:NAD(P)/FAD-dependent oxidoreductase n=1 Tax=Fulvivirga aurantia TaxID=2529383 RepID=UPI0012BD2A90|nr:FAD-dependent oxidoreductase [Fulvivirga aurantia]MTI22050.1 FAD-binding protein [Fulvivirga aurantia]